ncbi:MAG: ATP-dependent DNA helicase RecG, partial [Oscillospiraceae bacterium]|nr:ATP-dependent DNA helicase RecG [Oscillospiraceae bacterium]
MTTRCIMPVYRLSAGLGNKYMIGCVRRVLELAGEDVPDYLPESVRQAQGLAQARFSYENIHLPTDLEMLELARRRLI